jgi:hypothetical protein
MTKALLALLLVAWLGCDQMRQRAKPRPQQADYFAKKRECLELSIKRQAREAAADAKHPSIAGFIDLRSEQCYVPSMNTCIYESGFLDAKTTKSSMSIEDLLTGQVLAGGRADDRSYKQERDRLFALCAK